MKPLAIDLFCGLSEPELCWGANMLVDKFVTRRTKNPDHVALAIRHEAPCAIAFEPGLMCDFNYSVFTTCFARRWKIWIAPLQSFQSNISIGTPGIIFTLLAWFLLMKRLPLCFSGTRGACLRAIALVTVRRLNAEVRAADTAITTILRNIGLFATAQSSSAALASGRAITFIRTFGLKCLGTFDAENIVHGLSIA